MNLSEYEKLDTAPRATGEYIKFEKTGDTRFLRFLYESGGDKMGEDIPVRRKKWDDAQHKFVYDTEDGTLTCALSCIEYDEDGSNPRLVIWERSAYFCKNTLLPMFRNYPRIIDAVWKVTATNPKTTDASYSLFPVMNADTIKYPIIKADSKEEKKDTKSEAPAKQEEQPKAPAQRKKYWE